MSILWKLGNRSRERFRAPQLQCLDLKLRSLAPVSLFLTTMNNDCYCNNFLFCIPTLHQFYIQITFPCIIILFLSYITCQSPLRLVVFFLFSPYVRLRFEMWLWIQRYLSNLSSLTLNLYAIPLYYQPPKITSSIVGHLKSRSVFVVVS